MKQDDYVHNCYEGQHENDSEMSGLNVMVSPYQNLLDEIIRAIQQCHNDPDEDFMNRQM